MTSCCILVREKKEQGGGLVLLTEGEDHVPERLVREMRTLLLVGGVSAIIARRRAVLCLMIFMAFHAYIVPVPACTGLAE